MAKEAVSVARNYDPLKEQLERLGFTPVSFGLFLFLANLAVDAWLGWRYGVFTTESGASTPGLLQDFTALAVDFISLPIVGAIYFWSAGGSERLFGKLQEAEALQSAGRLKAIFERGRARFYNRPLFYAILALSIVLALAQLGTYQGWVPVAPVAGYVTLNPALSFFRAPFWFLSWYVVLFLCFNVGNTIVVLRQVFREGEIRLLLRHPDYAGGLGAVSGYLGTVAWAIWSLGLVFTAGTLYEIQQGNSLLASPQILAGSVVYVLGVAAFFFLPLLTTHSAMQAAKDAELLTLAKQMDEIYRRGKRGEGDRETDKARFEQLESLYALAEGLPTWPFAVRYLRRFATVITTPLIPAAVSIIIDNVIPAILPF